MESTKLKTGMTRRAFVTSSAAAVMVSGLAPDAALRRHSPSSRQIAEPVPSASSLIPTQVWTTR